MSPEGLPADGEARWRRLAELGAGDEIADELLAYTENPYRRAAGGAELPLADEAHLGAWRGYRQEAMGSSAAAVLCRRLVQLRFPVREGMSGKPVYRRATRRCVEPEGSGEGARFADPGGIDILIHPTPAGAVPVVVARRRADFVLLVRALAGRNEPVEVPDSMGACLIKGLVNCDRVHAHRERWSHRQPGPPTAAAWERELRALAPRKELYQDRVLLLSTGPYSAVLAPSGFGAADWLEVSGRIRLDHECFHYLTLRRYGLIRSNLLDELLADLAGLVAALGEYRADLARLFLGLERFPEVRPSGRIHSYYGDPPLSAPARRVVQRLAFEAIAGLERIVTRQRLALAAAPKDRGSLLLALAATGLEALAGPEAERTFAESWRPPG